MFLHSSVCKIRTQWVRQNNMLAVSKLARNMLKHVTRSIMLDTVPFCEKLLNLELQKSVNKTLLHHCTEIPFWYTAKKDGVVTLFTSVSPV